jgi:SNF2 family DNA or RNA helicase
MTVRHKFEDCVDIPPTHMYTVNYELTPKQRAQYHKLEDTSLLNLSKSKLTAINAASVATKLLQLCSGAVYDNDKVDHLIETDRYAMITDMIEQRAHSLVFFQWKHQKEQLCKLAKARGITFCVLDGEASSRDRDEMIAAYQAGMYQTMFAHPKSAAHGLTLTRGTSTIWAGPIHDLELFSQGNKRQARIGQKQKTEIVVVIAKDTIEERVYELLTGKNARMKTLLDLFT